MLDVSASLRQGDFVLDASFQAPAGVTALFGPSGSGKSTLFAAIAGLLHAAGHVTLNGEILQGPTHRRSVGLVFQDGRLFPHLTVRGNLAYAWKRAAPSRRRSIDDIARFFDIAVLLDRGVKNLSGGERARVALARALVAAPKLLLLDEPFAALDGPRRQAFIGILRELHREFSTPTVVVTHQIDDAAALADHLIALQQGRVVASGSFTDVTRAPAFRALLDVRDTGTAVPSSDLVTGARTPAQFLWLRADQILLTTRKPEAISARNVLQGEVVSVTPETSGSQLVELQTRHGPILSRLTTAAVAELSLAPGSTVWALVKAHAL